MHKAPYATHQFALQTTHRDNQSVISRFAGAQPFNNDFGRARQAGRRVEITRIEQQRRGNEFIERPFRGPTSRYRSKIARETPARIERHPVCGHSLLAHQCFEPGERRVHVHFVDHRDERCDRRLANDLVSVLKAHSIRD